jgi:hypothetical protein
MKHLYDVMYTTYIQMYSIMFDSFNKLYSYMWQLHYNWYKFNIQLTIMLQLVYDFDTNDRAMYTHFHYSLYMKLATSCQL